MKFATAINCMDGRVQLPLIGWIKENYNTDFVDVITEPGPNKILADGKNRSIIASIRDRVDISVNKHGSKLVVIAGHYDCAGNPTGEIEQKEHIKKAIEEVLSWGLDVEIVGVWIDQNWRVNKLD